MTPQDTTVARLKTDARLRPRGNSYEAFEIGQRFTHHWGRTVTAADNTLFSTLTLHYNPFLLTLQARFDFFEASGLWCFFVVLVERIAARR